MLFSCWCLVYTATNLTNLDIPEFVNSPVLCIIVEEDPAGGPSSTWKGEGLSAEAGFELSPYGGSGTSFLGPRSFTM